MKAIDVEEFAQTCLDIEKDQKEQGDYANALFISAIRKMISTYPTVDAVPVVHGRWISDEAYGHIKVIDGIPNGSCICSVCGKWLTGSDEYDVYGNYCPSCGAKMDLEEQDATD